MGRHVEVSHLTDDECRHIVDVVTKDFALRKTEFQRIRRLQRRLDEMKRVIAVKSSHASESLFGDCCMVCGSNLLKFCCLFSRSRDCLSCQHEVCPNCRRILQGPEEEHYLCLLCVKKREVKRKSSEWFYDVAEKRFKRFGSAKALRAMHRQRDNVEPRVVTLLALMKELSFGVSSSTPRPLSSLLDSKEAFLFEPAVNRAGNKSRPRSRSSSEIMLSALGQKNDQVIRKRKTSESSVEQGEDVLAGNCEQHFASTTKLKHVLKASASYPATSSDVKITHMLSRGSSESSDEKISFSENVLTEVEFVGLAVMTVILSLILSFVTCVGYIGEIHSDSEEEDKTNE